MRYFHRTSLPPDDVLEEADRYFSQFGNTQTSDVRTRVFTGATGSISLSALPEGGHYTRVTVETDGMNEGETEKLSRRFFTTVHNKAHAGHVPRGGY